MSRIFAAITIVVLIFVLAVPAFAREHVPSITDGTSNTILTISRGLLPYIEQENVFK